VHGETWVSLVEFSTPIKAMGLMSYGDASQPGSPHRSDQLKYLSTKTLRTLWTTRAQVDAASRGAGGLLGSPHAAARTDPPLPTERSPRRLPGAARHAPPPASPPPSDWMRATAVLLPLGRGLHERFLRARIGRWPGR